MAELPTGHGHLPLHRRRGVDAAAARARRLPTRTCSPSIDACCASASTRHGGVEVDTQGDAFFVAFAKASDALAAAAEGRAALAAGPIRVRIGVHTGEPTRHRRGLCRYRRPPGGADRRRGSRRPDPRLAVDAGPRAGGRLRDLGEHRLKDLTAPERIFQLGTTISRRSRRLNATNLPVPRDAASSVASRSSPSSAAAAARRSAARHPDRARVGRVRRGFALQAVAAELVEDFADGVWFVPLASLADRGARAPTVATGARRQGRPRRPRRRPADSCSLLDNFEHLLARRTRCRDLLARVRELTVLVTSREPLRTSTASGSSPSTRSPSAQAVELFVQRARQPCGPTSTPRRARARSAARSTTCRSRSSSRPRASRCSRRRDLLERLEQRLPLLAGGTRTRPSVSARCARRSSGATTC